MMAETGVKSGTICSKRNSEDEASIDGTSSSAPDSSLTSSNGDERTKSPAEIFSLVDVVPNSQEYQEPTNFDQEKRRDDLKRMLSFDPDRNCADSTDVISASQDMISNGKQKSIAAKPGKPAKKRFHKDAGGIPGTPAKKSRYHKDAGENGIPTSGVVLAERCMSAKGPAPLTSSDTFTDNHSGDKVKKATPALTRKRKREQEKMLTSENTEDAPIITDIESQPAIIKTRPARNNKKIKV